jgi:hypothetical protein
MDFNSDTSVKVAVRIRPLSFDEETIDNSSAITANEENRQVFLFEALLFYYYDFNIIKLSTFFY